MHSLKSGLFYIRDKKFEQTDWHITRLSLNFNLDARQPYFVGNREYMVSPGRYLLINEGEAFKTCSIGERTQRMLTIAFQVGLAQDVYHTMTKRADNIFDHQKEMRDGIDFFQKTYTLDPYLDSKVQYLVKVTEAGCEENIQDEYEQLLMHIIANQYKIKNDIASIKKVKPATKKELFKQLNYAMEYIQGYYFNEVNIETLARISCLSSFYFKRLFKEVYGISPYQLIKDLRLKKAQVLLEQGVAVNEVCQLVGWENTSSFARLFKKKLASTPSDYQRKFLKKCDPALFSDPKSF